MEDPKQFRFKLMSHDVIMQSLTKQNCQGNKNAKFACILKVLHILKGSYDVAKKNIILCIRCNAMCLCGLRFKKHIIFHILYIIVAPLCSAFLKRVDFYKAHRSENSESQNTLL